MRYRWIAIFKDRIIQQPEDDKYSKYNPDAEWNPSSFRDFQDYFDEHNNELVSFGIWGDDKAYVVHFPSDCEPYIEEVIKGDNWGGDKFAIVHRENEPLSDIRVIYYRRMELEIKGCDVGSPRVLGYCIGYQGIDKNGNNRQKILDVV